MFQLNKGKADYSYIQESPLFDADWYRKRYLQGQNVDNPAAHYVTQGWQLGYDPSPLFSNALYQQANPDVKTANLCPLLHYECYGKAEGRELLPLDYRAIKNSPYFNLQWYMQKYLRTPEEKADPIAHYLTTGWKLGYAPSPEFNSTLYFDANPDLKDLDMCPLLHYETKGRVQNRRISSEAYTLLVKSEYFDRNWYINQYPTHSFQSENPALHYLNTGWREGKEPGPRFNTALYYQAYPEAKNQKICPLLHYEKFEKPLHHDIVPIAYQTIRDSAFFDAAWYRNEYAAMLSADEDIILHYLTTGWKSGCNPGPGFSAEKYYEANPDVKTAGICPLLHYETSGKLERRHLAPENYDLISASKSFDCEWYCAQYPDVAQSGIDPVTHYLTTGWKLGYDAGPHFSTAHYLEANPDVADAGICPLVHYEKRGKAEHRRLALGNYGYILASPLFDAAWYVTQYPEVLETGMDPITHYLELGWRDGLNPGPDFDGNEYLAENNDVFEADLCPLLHYEKSGRKEGRRHDIDAEVVVADSPLFDGAWYFQQYPEAYESGLSAAMHYLTIGWKQHMNPGPDFNGDLYLDANTDVKKKARCPLVHYELCGKAENRKLISISCMYIINSPYFDADWYLAQYPDVAESHFHPALHYLRKGWKENRNPGPEFNSEFYLDANPGVKKQKLCPLFHYERTGRKRGAPLISMQCELILNSEYFNSAWYVKTYPIVQKSKMDPVLHYLKKGWKEKRNPGPKFNGNLYFSGHPDAYRNNVCPLLHYELNLLKELNRSDYECIQNSEFFDRHWYAKKYKTVLQSVDDLVLHYLYVGWKEGRNPSPRFYNNRYLRVYPEAKKENICPLLHFERTGMHDYQLIVNSPLFDATWYQRQYPEIAKEKNLCATFLGAAKNPAVPDPAMHYLQKGWKELRNPSADFNSTMYLEVNPEAKRMKLCPLLHYEQQGRAPQIKTCSGDYALIHDSKYFNAKWYQKQNPEVMASKADPVLHYLYFGWKAGKDPSKDFSTNLYLTLYPGVKRAGMCPLLHYEKHGKYEGRKVATPKSAPRYHKKNAFYDLARFINQKTHAGMIRKNASKRILVSLHLFYMEAWIELEGYLKNLNAYQYDLHITYDESRVDTVVLEKIRIFKPDTVFISCGNVGFDVAPFLLDIDQVDLDQYDIVIKLHSKGVARQNLFMYKQMFHKRDWFLNLFRGVVGTSTVHNSIDILSQENEYGIVSAKNLIVIDPLHKQRMVHDIMNMLDIEIPEEYYYVAGTCFAIRASILKRIQSMHLSDGSFMESARGNFSFAHSMERIVCLDVLNHNYKFYGNDVSRLRRRFRNRGVQERIEKSAIRLLDDTRFDLDEDFFYRIMETKQIDDYEIVEIPLKDIRRVWLGKTLRLTECHPYKYLMGDTALYDEYCDFHANNNGSPMCPERFDALISSINENGFDPRKIIVVNQDNVIQDGQHRSCCLMAKYGGEYKVRVLRVHYTQPKQAKAPKLKRPVQEPTYSANRDIIFNSPLFDETWYKQIYGIENNTDAANHYLTQGWRNGNDPSPNFSTMQYLLRNDDVRKAQKNPLLHYETEGRAQNRLLTYPERNQVSASPYFDAAWYVSTYRLIPGTDAAKDYHEIGWTLGKQPSPSFSTTRYLTFHADVRRNCQDPLLSIPENETADYTYSDFDQIDFTKFQSGHWLSTPFPTILLLADSTALVADSLETMLANRLYACGYPVVLYTDTLPVADTEEQQKPVLHSNIPVIADLSIPLLQALIAKLAVQSIVAFGSTMQTRLEQIKISDTADIFYAVAQQKVTPQETRSAANLLLTRLCNRDATLTLQAPAQWKLVQEAKKALSSKTDSRKPLVSVIIPCSNHAASVRRRLESIYHQTYQNIEVILVDDASTDGSRNILAEYAQLYPKMTKKLWRQKKADTMCQLWATALQLAQGEICWIAEADDHCTLDFIEKLVPAFEDEKIMLSYSRFVYIDQTGHPQYNAFENAVGAISPIKWQNAYTAEARDEVRQALGIQKTIPSMSGLLFRKDAATELLQNETWQSMQFCGDWMLCLRLLQHAKISYQPAAICYSQQTHKLESCQNADNYFKELEQVALYTIDLYMPDEAIIRQNYLTSVALYTTLLHRENDASLEPFFSLERIFSHRRNLLNKIPE